MSYHICPQCCHPSTLSGNKSQTGKHLVEVANVAKSIASATLVRPIPPVQNLGTEPWFDVRRYKTGGNGNSHPVGEVHFIRTGEPSTFITSRGEISTRAPAQTQQRAIVAPSHHRQPFCAQLPWPAATHEMACICTVSTYFRGNLLHLTFPRPPPSYTTLQA